MAKSKLIMFLISVLLIFSCNKIDNDDIKKQDEGIIGEWIWLGSYGGFSGFDVRTPENTGIEKIVTFLVDSTVVITENGDTVVTTDYFLSREKSPLFNDTFNFLTINYKYWILNPDSIVTLPMRYRILELNDTLNIDEDVDDGYHHFYKRNKK